MGQKWSAVKNGSDVFGFSLTQEEIDDMREWTQADAGVNEVKSEATIERMNTVFGAQHDHRLYIEFKWHKMVMDLLEREWKCGRTSERLNAVFGEPACSTHCV